MHRDLIWYVTFLTIVRLLIITACPAPNPWAKKGTSAIRPAHSHLPDVRLCRSVLSRPSSRPRDHGCTGAADRGIWPRGMDRPPLCQVPLSQVAAGDQLRPAGACAVLYLGVDLDQDGCTECPPTPSDRPAPRDVTVIRGPGGQSQRTSAPLPPADYLHHAGRPPARDSQRSGPTGAVTSPSARLPRHRVAAASGAGAPAHVPEAAPDGAGTTAPRKRRDRPTHRGRRSYVRKRGPRRHRRDWTDAAGPRELKLCALNIQSLKPKSVELRDEIDRFSYDFVALSETWLKPCIPNRLLTFPGYVIKRCDRPWAPQGHGGVAILFREKYQHKAISVPERASDASKLEALWSLFKWDNTVSS